MTPRASRLLTVALLATGSILVAEIAWGAGLSVTSTRLGAGTLEAPQFHPAAATIIGKGKAGTISKNDELVVDFSAAILVASICPGSPQQPNTVLSGVTVSLVDGGPDNDTLTVTAGPAGCPAPRVGTFDLGTTTHMTGATLTFTASQLTIVESGTISVLLGNQSRPVPGSAANATVVRYVPHASMSSSAGQLVSGTASTVSTVHF